MHYERTAEARYEIPAADAMRVPGVVFASEQLLPDNADETLQQVANVATLPGIVRASFAMPDLHLGYGFCIGGVAATDVDDGGVISPGGVGFDISCGVRVLLAPVTRGEVDNEARTALMDVLDRRIPRGTGPGGLWDLDDGGLRTLLVDGSAAAVAAGFGTDDDLAHTEDEGRLPDADPAQVSHKAVRRGLQQVGSLGGGNHFLEVQVVDRILDERAATTFGLHVGQLAVTIHCGSRGLGHQVCSDHVRVMQRAMDRHGIAVPDKQLACAPVESPEGRDYLGAMAAAANYGRANRQVLAEAARDAFGAAVGTRDLRLLYDVSHNMAKIERHRVVPDASPGGAGASGVERTLCVHRKGATLALPAGHPDLHSDFADVGQPVIVPGSMGTSSWILAGGRTPQAGGSDGTEAFASTCHGAGRARSRAGAKRAYHGATLRDELGDRGIDVRALSDPGVAEEAPGAYKDVDEVVRVCEVAGLSRRVARLLPLGVVKG
jgi:tRNA-splicing ligase RtcB